MIRGSGSCSLLAFSLLLLVGLPAEGQGGGELRCRGRGGAFVIDRIDASTVSMRFTASGRPAGPDGAGLDPGTCSFVDRVVETVEPLQIRFSANGAQLTSVRQELDDAFSYWCFSVAAGAKAFFKAGEQRDCTCGENAATGDPARQAAGSSVTSRGASAKADSMARALGNSSGNTGRANDEKTVKDEKIPKDVPDPRPPVITEVSAIPSGKNLAFAFKTFANITPQVEVATVPPVQGPDKRWSFPDFRPANRIEQTFLGTGPTVPLTSGIVKLLAGGNKALGRYTANVMQALDPGIVYYYIINVRRDNDPASEIRQMKGIIHTPGSNRYEVRYRGFYSDSTSNPDPHDIYAIVSTSYVFPTGDPAILSTMPGKVVAGVHANEAHPDSGTRVYRGEPADLLLTVTLMEHKGGDPNKYKTAVHEAFLNEVGRLLRSPTKVGGALQLVSDAVNGARADSDSVIATASRLVTAVEMKLMANNGVPKAIDRGMTHDFFTEHKGTAGAYRVYFDVISR